MRALQVGTVSTNVYLRRLHNFCVDMNWLPWPIVPKRQWPAVRFKDMRGLTAEEHERIVAREFNPERKAFYQLAWHLGASQSDLAHLQAEDVNWTARIICFVRQNCVLATCPRLKSALGRRSKRLLDWQMRHLSRVRSNNSTQHASCYFLATEATSTQSIRLSDMIRSYRSKNCFHFLRSWLNDSAQRVQAAAVA